MIDPKLLKYAISHKSLDAFTKVFPSFPKDRLIMSPNGIEEHLSRFTVLCAACAGHVDMRAW